MTWCLQTREDKGQTGLPPMGKRIAKTKHERKGKQWEMVVRCGLIGGVGDGPQGVTGDAAGEVNHRCGIGLHTLLKRVMFLKGGNIKKITLVYLVCVRY